MCLLGGRASKVEEEDEGVSVLACDTIFGVVLAKLLLGWHVPASSAP